SVYQVVELDVLGTLDDDLVEILPDHGEAGHLADWRHHDRQSLLIRNHAEALRDLDHSGAVDDPTRAAKVGARFRPFERDVANLLRSIGGVWLHEVLRAGASEVAAREDSIVLVRAAATQNAELAVSVDPGDADSGDTVPCDARCVCRGLCGAKPCDTGM